MKPGLTTRPFASMTASATSVSSPTSAIAPSLMATSAMASRLVSGSRTRPPRMIRSYRFMVVSVPIPEQSRPHQRGILSAAKPVHADAVGSTPLRWQPPLPLACYVLSAQRSALSAQRSAEVSRGRHRRCIALARGTDEARCIGRVAFALVARDLRIGTQGAAHRNSIGRLVVAVLCRGDRLWRGPVLNPALERGLGLEHLRPRAALAMIQAGDQEQAIEIRRRIHPPVRALGRLHPLIVVDGVAWWHHGIGAPVKMNELAAGAPESGEIRAPSVDYRREPLITRLHAGAELEAVPVPIQAGKRPHLPEIHPRRAVCVRRIGPVQAPAGKRRDDPTRILAAFRPAGIDLLALMRL